MAGGISDYRESVFPAHDNVDIEGLTPKAQQGLAAIASAAGFPLRVASGYRSPEYNRSVGGASRSRHTSGDAIDFDLSKYTPEQRQKVFQAALASGAGGVGFYDPEGRSMHIDFRPGRVFWDASRRSAPIENAPSWAQADLSGWIGGKSQNQQGGGMQIKWDDEAPSAPTRGGMPQGLMAFAPGPSPAQAAVPVPPMRPEGLGQSPAIQVQWDDAPAQAPAPQATMDNPPPFGTLPDKIGGPQDPAALAGLQARAPGMGQAAARGAVQGFTYGNQDEMAGAGAASPIPGSAAASQTTFGALSAPDVISGAGRLALERLAPGIFGNSATKQYEAARNQQREANAAAQMQNPITYGASEIGGIIANPVTRAFPGSLQGAAAGGAVVGGAMGAGNAAEASNIPRDALVGGLTGGAMGAGAYGVLKGIGALASMPASRVATALNGVRNPEGEAAKRVSDALRRDAKAGEVMTPQQLAAAQALDQPVVVGDLGGETTRALARSAANTSPEGRQALQSVTQGRYDSQNVRTADFMSHLFKYNGNISAVSERLSEAARAQNRPLYERAYKEGANGIWSQPLADIANSPAVRAAIGDAERRGANDAVARGFERVRNPFTTDEAGNFALRQGKNGEVAYPSLAFWDQVKRGLDAQIAALRRSGDPEAGTLTQLKNQLVKELDTAAPTYQEARGMAAKFFGADDAIEAGQKFVQANMRPEDVRIALGKMSEAEREMFRQGFASKVVDDIRNSADRNNIVNRIAQSPAAREKMELALGGPKQYAQLEAFIRTENIMNALKGAVQGNSSTARQLIEAGLAGGAVGLGTGDMSKGGAAAIGLIALRKGNSYIDQQVARKVSDLLASGSPEAMREVVRRAASDPKYSKVLAAIDNGMSSASVAGGGQASQALSTQFQNIPRAAAGGENREKP